MSQCSTQLPEEEETLSFKTTVDSSNRRRDRNRVISQTGLREEGDKQTEIASRSQPEVLLAKEYERIVYGDHGPYMEFKYDQVNWQQFKNYDNKRGNPYYLESSNANETVKAYRQLRDVKGKPSPPKGLYSQRNSRQEGYADYKPNRVYIPVDSIERRRNAKAREEENCAKSDEPYLI